MAACIVGFLRRTLVDAVAGEKMAEPLRSPSFQSALLPRKGIKKNTRTEREKGEATHGTFSKKAWLRAAKASLSEFKAAVGPFSFSMSEDRVSHSLVPENERGSFQKSQ